MNNRTIIFHDEMGVFVGQNMGLAFWSMLECAGQWNVAIFLNEKDARELIAEWKPAQDPDNYQYKEVKTKYRTHATIAELLKAGVDERYTRRLLLNAPCAIT
jgi:hypothetical protein